MADTHIQCAISIECKCCGHKNTKVMVLKIGNYVNIGCSQCKQTSTRFKVSQYVSWSSSNSDLYIKIVKH